MTEPFNPRDELERALDASLTQVLAPPQPPQTLRVGLRAAIARDPGPGLAQARARFERELAERQTELAQQYVRLRLKTLGVMLGAAFALGAAATIMLPWLTVRLGTLAPICVASAFAVTGIGLGVGISWWLGWRRDPGLEA
jgi:hypothetical protein